MLRARASEETQATLIFTDFGGRKVSVEFSDLDLRWSDDIGSPSGCRIPDGFDPITIGLATNEISCGFLDIDRLDLGIFACPVNPTDCLVE